jgi:hypothetical protein
MNSTQQQFDPAFPFGDEVFLSAEPMSDEAFEIFVQPTNNEIPVDEVYSSKSSEV